MKRLIWPSLLGIMLLHCYLGSGQSSDGSAPVVDSVTSSDHGATGSGLPCEVSQLLSTFCASCHGTAPSSGVSLAALGDLNQPSKTDPSMNNAQRVLVRLKAGSMPPAGLSRPSVEEMAMFEAWVNGGLQPGSCTKVSDGGGPDPFAGPHVCSSNSFYTTGEGNTMKPGNACIRCHASEGEAPRFIIAGTVYPTAHEPADCNAIGVNGAQISVVDKSGATHLYNANAVGNFTGMDLLTLPFTAEVRFGGKSRVMATPQTDGDCNVCHTENGANGAPGRILLPN